MSRTQILRPLYLVAATASSLVPLSAANLIVNGDFSGGTGGTLTGATGGGNNVPDNWSGFATGSGSLRVLSGRVNFNGNNQPTGNYVEQSVTTSTNLWYAMDWLQAAHTGGDNAGVMVTSTLTSGPATTTNSYRGLQTSAQLLIFAASTSTTVRLSDVGAATNSLDTRIDNVNFDLADGQYNVASIATLSSDSQFGGGWGNEENAVDGRIANSSNTVFHNNSNNGWLDLDFTSSYTNAYIDGIELVARPGYNSRKGDTVDIYSTSGSLIESIDITGSDGLSSVTINGVWKKVGRIRVTENGQTLNVSEIRAFSSFINGVAVPEPASSSMLALGGIALLLRRRKQ